MGTSPARSGGSLISAAMRHLGSRNFTGLHAAWCGAAMNRFAREAGKRPIGSNRAIDWRKAGAATSPHPGAVAVFRHHVGIVLGVSGGRIELISGNHSHKVGIGSYAIRSAVAFRAL